MGGHSRAGRGHLWADQEVDWVHDRGWTILADVAWILIPVSDPFDLIQAVQICACKISGAV